MIPDTNPKALEERLNDLKTTVRDSMNNSIKKIKEEVLFDGESRPVSHFTEIFLKFCKGISGMMPLKSVGPFF